MEALFGADYERITDDNAVDLEADVEDLTATWKACATAGTIVSAMLKRDGEHFGKVVDRQTIEVDGETQKRVLISTDGFKIDVPIECVRLIPLRQPPPQSPKSPDHVGLVASNTPFMDVFGSPDMLKYLVDVLDAPSAACMMRVYIGSCDRDASGAKAPNKEIAGLIRDRLPHLHIYTTPTSFPHHIETDGEWQCHRDRYVEIAIGFVTKQQRDALRTERLASKYSPELSGDAKRAQLAKLRNNPHLLNVIKHSPRLTTKLLREERHKDMVADGHDFGYDEDEHLIRAISAVHVSGTNSKPERRVKDDGWSVRETVTHPDYQYVTHDFNELFHIPPAGIDLKLVYADTGAVVNPDAPYGGLKPDKWMRDASEIRLSTTAPNHNANFRHDNRLRTLTGNVATLVRMKPNELTSKHKGAHFKVQVTCTARHKRTGDWVTLRAESKPMVFKSDKRHKTTVVGARKRKVEAMETNM